MVEFSARVETDRIINLTAIYWVKCEACECESSTFKTKEEAEKAWNRRIDLKGGFANVKY